ncbi:MAG: zinc protease [Clostridiales bacterium GWB2_37_7]|nr:MAG: zinc protease [Clostridiales bacterium GWB2_37_7]
MYQKQQMKNGIRVVTEEIPYVNSVSVGIWVKVGSRNETNNINGVSHFIEHMLFKGTQKRSAKEIANSIDKIGGQLNAFTAKESTCYYAKVLDSHFDIALDVLADMFLNSSFAKEEIEKEKGVIMEEINMYEDSPEDLVHDLFSQGVWSGNPLGMSILGTEESLNVLNRDRMVNYYKDHYIPENIVISVAGNIKHQVVVEKVEKYFGHLISPLNKLSIIDKPAFDPIKITRNKDTEQVHLCIGFEGVETDNESFYPLLTMNNIFGGAMSSRLFQNIREDKGLAYSVFSYPSSYQDCGLYSIYAGMKATQLKTVTQLIMEEIHEIMHNGITEEELFDSKEQMKGSYTLGLESTSGRMISIGKSELIYNRIYSPSEVLEKIDRVEMDSVNKAIRKVFDLNRMGGAVIGSFDNKLDLRDILK